MAVNIRPSIDEVFILNLEDVILIFAVLSVTTNNKFYFWV